MTKTIKQTSLLTIRVGDLIKIIEDGRVGQLQNIELTPNGANDSKLVVVLTIKMETGYFIATSDKFEALPDFQYCERIYGQI